MLHAHAFLYTTSRTIWKPIHTHHHHHRYLGTRITRPISSIQTLSSTTTTRKAGPSRTFGAATTIGRRRLLPRCWVDHVATTAKRVWCHQQQQQRRLLSTTKLQSYPQFVASLSGSLSLSVVSNSSLVSLRRSFFPLTVNLNLDVPFSTFFESRIQSKTTNNKKNKRGHRNNDPSIKKPTRSSRRRYHRDHDQQQPSPRQRDQSRQYTTSSDCHPFIKNNNDLLISSSSSSTPIIKTVDTPTSVTTAIDTIAATTTSTTTNTIMVKSKKKNFYAVAAGRSPGIYRSWPDAEAQVKGYSKAKFKGFVSLQDAERYLHAYGPPTAATATVATTSSSSSLSAAASVSSSSAVDSRNTNRTRKSNQYTHAVANSARKRSSEEMEMMTSSSTTTTTAPSIPSLSSASSNNENETTSKKKPRTKKSQIKGEPTKNPSSKTKSQSSTTVPTSDDTNNDMDESIQSLNFQIYFDGGARGNPGVAGAGTFIAEKVTSLYQRTTTERSKTHIRTYLGTRSTNNEAEYTGVVVGLKHVLNAVRQDVTLYPNLTQINVLIRGDSNLIIQQLNGSWACKSKNLKPFLSEAQKMMKDLEQLTKTSNVKLDLSLEHVYREDNKIADALANEAMDQQQSWTTSSSDIDAKPLGRKRDDYPDRVHV